MYPPTRRARPESRIALASLGAIWITSSAMRSRSSSVLQRMSPWSRRTPFAHRLLNLAKAGHGIVFASCIRGHDSAISGHRPRRISRSRPSMAVVSDRRCRIIGARFDQITRGRASPVGWPSRSSGRPSSSQRAPHMQTCGGSWPPANSHSQPPQSGKLSHHLSMPLMPSPHPAHRARRHRRTWPGGRAPTRRPPAP
jgi:hypothetical protein